MLFSNQSFATTNICPTPLGVRASILPQALSFSKKHLPGNQQRVQLPLSISGGISFPKYSLGVVKGSLGPRPKTNPSVDHFQYTVSDTRAGWGLGTRLSQGTHIATDNATSAQLVQALHGAGCLYITLPAWLQIVFLLWKRAWNFWQFRHRIKIHVFVSVVLVYADFRWFRWFQYRILQNHCNMLQSRLPNMEVVSARLSQCN